MYSTNHRFASYTTVYMAEQPGTATLMDTRPDNVPQPLQSNSDNDS